MSSPFQHWPQCPLYTPRHAFLMARQYRACALGISFSGLTTPIPARSVHPGLPPPQPAYQHQATYSLYDPRPAISMAGRYRVRARYLPLMVKTTHPCQISAFWPPPTSNHVSASADILPLWPPPRIFNGRAVTSGICLPMLKPPTLARSLHYVRPPTTSNHVSA